MIGALVSCLSSYMTPIWTLSNSINNVLFLHVHLCPPQLLLITASTVNLLKYNYDDLTSLLPPDSFVDILIFDLHLLSKLKSPWPSIIIRLHLLYTQTARIFHLSLPHSPY